MFTLIEVTNPGWNPISVMITVLSDCVMIGALYWAHFSAKEASKARDEE